MTKPGVSIHLESDDEFVARLHPVTEQVGEFPDDRSVKTVGCAFYMGDVPVFFRSPAQMAVAVLELREASDRWQAELLHVARMGDDYVLAPYESAVSHRADLHDDGIDREAC